VSRFGRILRSLSVSVVTTGLSLSILAVGAIARWADAAGVDQTTRVVLVLLANVLTFAVLWCGQFALLDRVLRPRPGAELDRVGAG
jgi:hypothetical protein